MGNEKKILLIDDEKDFCFFVQNNLTNLDGYSVEYTTDPDKGIKLARQNKPDLILLDIKMAKKDGFQVLSILKKDLKTLSIPVVMLTALGDDDSKIKAAQMYDEDYIVKPVDHKVLKTIIGKVIARCQRAKSLKKDQK